MLGTTAAATFPVMLRSSIDGAWSLTAYNASVPVESLWIASRWWFVGLLLALLYLATLFRLHRGKAVAAPEGEGY
jgi:cytochrome d ubiquinol oxidase subunit II